MAKRKRDIQLKVRVTPEERAMIEAKMAQLGTTNMGAYLRKMAIDGYVVKLDLPELRELVSLLRYSSNNLNQLTRRGHETGRVYAAGMAGGKRYPVPPCRHKIMGYLSHVGAACCAQAAPAFLFPVILAIWSIFLYPVLTIQNEWRKKRCAFF